MRSRCPFSCVDQVFAETNGRGKGFESGTGEAQGGRSLLFGVAAFPLFGRVDMFPEAFKA
jgi:hypothetical protein